jgi:ubiquinone/menaquinone biosynthesis C-methylase UbiE
MDGCWRKGTCERTMDGRFQKRVQRYGWDKAATHYENLWGDQLEPAQTLLLDFADLVAGERVLDVACGTGLVAFRAASIVLPHGEVVGTDISEQMIATAGDIADARGIANAVFHRMDAEQLALDGASFDVALCALGLMYVPHPEIALGEMHRVLRPGGRAVCAVWGQRSKCGWAEIFPIVDARVQSEVCPMFFRLGAENALEQAFAAAGFGQIECRRLETRLHYADASEACEAAFVGGPVALAYSRFSEQTRAEARDDYLRSISPHRQGDSYAIPGEFVIVAGTK